jgi:hypothetical protein
MSRRCNPNQDFEKAGSKLSTDFAPLGPTSQWTRRAVPSQTTQNGNAIPASIATLFDQVHRSADRF